METKQNILLSNFTEQEKTAYITALAALATSDREASDEERENLREVSNSAGLSADQEETIMKAAQDTSGQELIKSLDVLKNSDLRYGLITDLIAMAKADESYTQDEKGNIEKVSRYLNVNDSQFSILDQFVNKAADEERTPEEYRKPDFLRSTGMQDKFSNAGFNMESIGKSIFGFLGPIILGGLAGRTLRGRNSSSISNQGGGLGGMLGGILSGNSSQSGMSGGLGGLLSGLARSRSNGSMGGLLGRLLR
jgi:uncharacterized tellurite resistance protein B-like protein